MDNLVGKRLDGRYELQEIIGVGGNGIMFKVNVFQKNHPSPPGRVAPCGETLFSAIL